MIFTGGEGTWATRNYALLPDILHSTDYVTTAPGDDPTAGPTTGGAPQDRPANIYILNPDQLTAIDVAITDSSGSYSVNIPANSMRSMQDLAPGRDIAPYSTVRMTSDRTFWGVTAYDYDTARSDWGHSWLAKKFLTLSYTVGHAPANADITTSSQLANPVFVAATADNTLVNFDLDNDGTFDQVDLDGDGTADTAPQANNTYVVDTPAALTVLDPTGDLDMTGTRIISNKPIAVSWGQNPEWAYGGGFGLDTGYTVYPVQQSFLDPAMTITKVADTPVVPLDPADPDDRIVTYTLTVKSYDFGPLTNIEVFDLLPIAVYGEDDYVSGTTLITCPNLTQGTADPTFDDCVTTSPDDQCSRLTWDIDGACGVGFQLNTNNTLTVSYQIRIPALPGGPPRRLLNQGNARGTLGGSVFAPTDYEAVVQTDADISKTVDLAAAAPGDVLTFTLTVSNNSTTTAETNVVISDAIPPDTTFCDATIDPVNCSNPTGTSPFTTGSFDPGQNTIEWTAASVAAGASATLTFQVKVNPTAVAGTLIPNQAGYESTETPYFLSNLVEPVVEGPILSAVKSIVGNPVAVHPYEAMTFDIVLTNSGPAAADNVLIIDQFPLNTSYVAGSMQWSLNSGPFTALTDADDGDEGSGAEGILNLTDLEFRLASLGSSQSVTLRFRAQVDPGTAGQVVFNQAIFASDETPSTDTNAVQVPIVGTAQINGHVYLDVNGNGVQDGGEPNIPNVDVEVSSVTRQNYSCTPGAAIPDNGYNGTQASMTCCALNVLAGDFGPTPSILDLDLDMALTHTWVGDLTIKIFGPGGQILAAMNRPNSTAPDTGQDTPYGYGTNWTGATVTFDDGGGGPSAETLGAVGTDICSVDGICSYVPAPDTAGGLPNLAGFNGTTPVGPWSVCVADSAPGDVGTFNSATLSFLTNESISSTQIVTTDAAGNYTAVVAGASAILDVDETDPDFPTGALLTTANDPQTIATVPGGTVVAPSVGYQQPALIFTKTSDAVDNEVSPGQTVTYTLEITNNTGTTQTGITVTDAVPTGTSYVAGSSQVNLPIVASSVRVSTGNDDAEENAGTGGMSLGSTDLEVVFDGGTQQIVGMRFQNVAIAPGTTISAAEIEFEVDETDSGTTNVSIFGQDSDTAATFTTTNSDISNRPATTATVAWNPPAWGTVSQKQITPDLSSIIQEIVDRPGWVSGNNIVIMIQAGTGCASTACQRTAESYNGEAANAALLRISTQVSAPAGSPPNLLTGGEGYTLAAGATMTLTFQVVVDDPLAGGITQIQNNATLTTVQQPGPWLASVTDDVVRAGVVVEYNNAGFDLVGSVVTYAHEIINTGEGDDSYEITLSSKEGWPVDLVDPGSGVVIASDADGDGMWDGGVTVNTGTLAPGGLIEYQLRVTIPSGASSGDTESTGLIATSGRNAGLAGIATDETIAVDSLDPIIFLPDNSGVSTAGGSAVYSHVIINNTGAPETFNLQAAREGPPSAFTSTFYWDSNGDGVYTDGVDIAITNTAQLADGASQLVFLVVDVPGGTADYTVDVVHLTAAAQSDPDNDFDTASDTTTVRPPVVLDLSGGGTRNVNAGGTAVFPGTARNFAGSSDVMNLDITASWFYGFDSYNHPTELWIDTDSDGTPDQEIAEDTDGDGTWDSIAPGYDTDTDNQPDVNLAAGGALAYELRRDVDALQGSARDPVTLTILSTNSTDQDSVTATNFVAAATKAVFASFDVFAVNSTVVVEWRTAVEVGTIGYELLRLREGEDHFSRVHDGLIKAVPGSLPGGTYTVIDRDAKTGDQLTYIVRELDVWGSGSVLGPITVTATKRDGNHKTAEAMAAGSSRLANSSSIRKPTASKAVPAGEPSGLVKVVVRDNGLIWLSGDQLATAFNVDQNTIAEWIGAGNLWIAAGSDESLAPFGLFGDGFESGDTSAWEPETKKAQVYFGITWTAAVDNSGLFFFGESIDSIYTDENIYWIGFGHGEPMARREAGTTLPAAESSFTNMLHIEEDQWPLTSVMTDPEADYWFWDFFFPYSGEPVASKTFSVATPGAVSGAGEGLLTVNFQGSYMSEVPLNHQVQIRLNNTQLGGTFSWGGHDAYDLQVAFPQSLLNDGDNTVEITALLADGLDFDEFYLDSFDIRYRRDYTAVDDRLLASGDGQTQITVTGFSTDDITVFDLTDPRRPVILDLANVVEDSGSFAVQFSTDSRIFPFLATTSSAALYPVAVVTDYASSLADSSNQGRYVVVAGEGLEAEATMLAAYRSQQGLSSVVARTVDIYDEFNGGIKNPWAIRRFLEHASENWTEKPEFVFLAGDGSLDHKGVGVEEDLVPSLMVVTDDGLVPSDNLFADWDGGDGVPEVAIGRLPAQSADELAEYRAKIEVFEGSSDSWKRHTLWLADSSDLGGEFSDDIEELIGAMPPEYSIQRVFLEDYEIDEAWQLTLDTMTKGAILVNFLGHGGFDRLADEGLIITENAATMNNSERTPFLTALSCIVGRFDVPGYDTLSEALLLNPNGGSIAVWSPSAYALNADSRVLGRYHASVINDGEVATIGQSVREALMAYVEDAESNATMPYKFILLGDPATTVEW